MDTIRLGASGLTVSRVILGCMSYGEPDRGGHPWSLPPERSRPFYEKALEAGITTFDTANVYSAGSSEEITGSVLLQLAKRDEVVIATKVHGRMGPGTNGAGLSRGAIMTQIDASLTRLGTDYVDLYQIHRFDPEVPIAETMAALHDVVKSGKARYIGASSMWTWQFAEMQHVARNEGLTEFVSMQDQYSLLMREEEREMLPYCLDSGVGIIPWSPLARGRLTRDWEATTNRTRNDAFASTLFDATADTDRRIVEAVARVAEGSGVPRAQIALAWVLAQETVTAPIVGVTKPEQLADAVAAEQLELDDDELATLSEHYVPHAPTGF